MILNQTRRKLLSFLVTVTVSTRAQTTIVVLVGFMLFGQSLYNPTAAQIIDPNDVDGTCYGGCDTYEMPETSVWDEDGDGSIWDDTSSSPSDDGGYGGYDNWYGTETYQPSMSGLASQRAYAANADGVTLYNQGNFAGAEERFRTALTDDPNNSQYRTNLRHSLEAQGNRAMELEDYSEAITLYEQALSVTPNDPEMIEILRYARGTRNNSMGNQYWNTGDYAAAVRHYEMALQFIPNDPIILANLQDARDMFARGQRVLNVEQKEQDITNMIAGVTQSLAQEGTVYSSFTQGLDFIGASSAGSLQPASTSPTMAAPTTDQVASLPKGPVDCRSTNPEVVNLCDVAQDDMRIDPILFQAPSPSVKVSNIPSPSEVPAMTWAVYVRSTPSELILDALEKGDGDLDVSIAYLDSWIREHPNHRAESAISYLEGLKTSFIAADADWKRQGGGVATIENQHLLEAVSGMRVWPGKGRTDDAEAIEINELDWRNQRSAKMLEAIDLSDGDLMRSFEILQKEDSDLLTAANAHRYLQGVYAYWDYLETHGDR